MNLKCNKECLTGRCQSAYVCGYKMDREGEFITTPYGNKIKVDFMTVNTHISKHKISQEEICNNLTNPHIVIEDGEKHYSYIERNSKSGRNPFLVVISAIFSGLGHILTAFPTKNIKEDEGEIIYEDE